PYYLMRGGEYTHEDALNFALTFGTGLVGGVAAKAAKKPMKDALQKVVDEAPNNKYYRRLAGFSSKAPIEWQIERLIAMGGKPVKVGELNASHIADIKKVVSQNTGQLFETADGSIYASRGLLLSLRNERAKHADRLISEMPDFLQNGNVRGNYNQKTPDRPIIIRPSTADPKKFDVMVLDAELTPGEIGIPTMMTAPKHTIKKAPVP
ncbi:MAG: hypothetical protein ACPGOY_10365, partial [Rhodospirillaceae bacterium]